jgi:uncharacterized membrane protein YkgB
MLSPNEEREEFSNQAKTQEWSQLLGVMMVVGVTVITVLVLIGPAIGNVFSNIVSGI